MSALPDSVGKLYEELDALVRAGKDTEARQLLLSRIDELPEDLRVDIMFDLFSDGLDALATGEEYKRDIQHDVLDVVHALKEGGGESRS